MVISGEIGFRPGRAGRSSVARELTCQWIGVANDEGGTTICRPSTALPGLETVSVPPAVDWVWSSTTDCAVAMNRTDGSPAALAMTTLVIAAPPRVQLPAVATPFVPVVAALDVSE